MVDLAHLQWMWDHYFLPILLQNREPNLAPSAVRSTGLRYDDAKLQASHPHLVLRNIRDKTQVDKNHVACRLRGSR